MIERAKNYLHSTENPRAMQFAYQSIFGIKEPVYSDYHLSLCEPKTLLILRSDSQQKMLLLHKALATRVDDELKFEVSIEVIILRKELELTRRKGMVVFDIKKIINS